MTLHADGMSVTSIPIEWQGPRQHWDAGEGLFLSPVPLSGRNESGFDVALYLYTWQ